MRRGRSSISDFFANFNAAYDATSKVGRDIELANVADAKPEESTGFTQEQGQELENIAKQGFNNITFDDATKSYVAKNAAGEAKTIAQQGVTDFMGQRYAGQGQQVQNNAKNMAIAGVFDRYDPEAGMNMRAKANDLAFQAKQRERTEKDWASEDSIKAIDQEMGAALKASMVDKDGQPVQVTPDMYLANIQQRAGRLAQAGHSKQAQEAMQQFYGMADVKLRLDSKQREQDAIPAMTAFKSGNTQALVDYYNKYVPGGAKISSIERTKDGAYVISSAGPGGESLPSRTLDERGMLAMAQSLNDPKALLQHAWDEANYGLRLRSEKRADLQLAETGRHHQATESIAAARGAANPGGLGREERMRATSLLGETSRRITEAQKTLAALQKDFMYSSAKPGSPQHAELQGLRDSIAALTEERKTYQGMLAGSQAPNSPPAATAGAAAGTGGKPSWQPDEVHSDQVRVIQGELEKALAPGGRNEDVPALQRELKRLGVDPGQSPQKIGSAVERERLPNGARYVDPNGVVRVKQQEASAKSAPAPRAAASPAAAPMPQEVGPSTKQALDDFNRGFQRSPAEIVAANMERDRQQAEARRLADEEAERKKAAQQKQIAESFATAQEAMRRRIGQ